MPVEEAPEDDEVRQTYNFAPGHHGIVYRADTPNRGAQGNLQDREQDDQNKAQDETTTTQSTAQTDVPGLTRYKLQKMKWGLVPFWTKRNPDYSSIMKSINARDDSLASKGGMWQTMKEKKRCIVVAEGFYEWLKKNNVKEKIPHFTRLKDGQLMLFAGLWDCVQYEGSDERHYTYSIITTDSNEQLTFLHDRMPVILENGSDQIRTWLDPKRSEWSKDLQSLLKPFQGELDCYVVTKDVNKVGNNSPQFTVPVASSENKNNIANFFGGGKSGLKSEVEKEEPGLKEEVVKESGNSIKQEADEKRTTVDQSSTEDNAPLPAATSSPGRGIKREHDTDEEGGSEHKSVRRSDADKRTKSPEKTHGKKSRRATSNSTAKTSTITSVGSQTITNFFNK